MRALEVLAVCLGGLLLAGCVTPLAAEELPIRTLAKGAFSGLQEPKEDVVRDKASWEKLWAKHIGTGRTPEKIPEVDFAKEMVVVLTMGRQRSGGYSIQLTKAEAVNGKLRLTVTRKTPGAGTMALQALTAPFFFAAVPKRDLPVDFVEAK